VIDQLARRIRSTLAPVVGRRRHAALVDFPNHSNVGDNAIWLGELAWLAEAGVDVRYRCEMKTYDPAALAQALGPDGTIFIHGGGNLGDLWPKHQRLREAVIRDFPDRPIVQLPQTLHFRDRDSLARTRAVFDGHPDLTLCVRDRASLELAGNEFRATTLLCPDMAFYLGPLPRLRAPRRDIFWLRRDDREASGATETPSSPELAVADWLDDRRSLPDRARRALRRRPLRWLARTPPMRRTISRFVDASYDWQAERRLRFGCRLLASGSVVVTDRLHAHILSLLLGIPHVVLDNNYGKLRRFCETWDTLSSPLVRWADAPPAALAEARALLDGGRHVA
jgi:pyruvyl transferase EpsO